MADTYTLLIWEEIPENTRLALIPNDALDDEDRRVLRAAHGKYINSTGVSKEDLVVLDCLNNALCPKDEYLSDEHPKGSKWAMRWHAYLKADEDSNPIEGENITYVYRAGFIL